MALSPVTDADRRAHYDAGALTPATPQPYEWWYFEFHFKGPALDHNGHPVPGEGVDDYVVVQSCHRPHFFDPVRLLDVDLAGSARDHTGSGQKHPTFDYSGLATSIYRLSPTEPLIDALVGFSATRTSTSSATMDATQPFRASWGVRPACRIDETAAGFRLQMHQKGWWGSRGIVDKRFRGRRPKELGIEIDVEFRQQSPGFKVDGGVLMTDQWGGEHNWCLQMPDARVVGRVKLVADGVTVLDAPVDTIGYHDHQWGPSMPLYAMDRWSWGRVLVSPDGAAPHEQDLLVFFEARPLGPAGGPQRGTNTFVYVPHGSSAIELTGGAPAVRAEGWDKINYPLEGYDPEQMRWSEGRITDDVRPKVAAASPSGTPFYVPADDTVPHWFDQMVLLAGRPLARWSMKDGVGYQGMVTCTGTGATGPGGVNETHQMTLIQRGCTIEPWPFYNRYIPDAWVRDPVGGAASRRVRFALSEFMEVNELIHNDPTFTIRGKTFHVGLLGIGVFSELMTDVEPGAPGFWPAFWAHLLWL